MKNKVDRILNGATVNIASDPRYVLSVSKIKDWYRVGWVEPEHIEKGSRLMSLETMREAGNKLIELADELESRKRFKEGDKLCFIRPDGEIRAIIFFPSDGYHLGLVMSGNAFKTEAEAEAHKDDVLAKFQDLRDQGLV